MVHEQQRLRINWRPLDQSWEKSDPNISVLPTKVVRDVLAPARERHDPHKPLRLRTTFLCPIGIGHGIIKLCACAVVCEGHGAPVQAPARPAQLSPVNQICFGHFSWIC